MCTIPKIFSDDKICWVMKLNKSKILEILRLKNQEWTSYKIRKKIGVSEQRVNQIIKEYRTTGIIPVVGEKLGRPPKLIQEWEVKIVKQAYEKYHASASVLEQLIKGECGKHVPHNRIHKILLQQGLAKKGEKVIRKKKWIRYERRHSLTAVHVDWHQRPNDGPWVFGVEDDASRAMLAMIETNSATTEASIQGMETALQHGQIKQCISDHGCQFTANQEGAESTFKQFLDKRGIKQILCRIKHPQSNGKIEKFFHLYERHRDAFSTLEEFMHWYNHVRPHLSLDFSTLETPWKAFQRKMRCQNAKN